MKNRGLFLDILFNMLQIKTQRNYAKIGVFEVGTHHSVVETWYGLQSWKISG